MFAKIILIINLILILIVIICERKNLKPIIFWSILILFFSFIGFLLYIIFGNRLKFKAKREILNKKRTTKNYIKYTDWYKKYNKTSISISKKQLKFCSYIDNKCNSPIWHNNFVKIFNDSEEFLNSLIKDIKNAKKYIFLEFYIFSSDKVGKLIANELIQKARNGVEIKLLYDAIGCKKNSNMFYNFLVKNGIEICEFFPSILKTSYINFKINYRNHRKIVVIDGNISYIGGFNIRDDHFGYDKKLKPWKDCATRVVGNATYALTDIFLNDWCYAKKENLNKIDVNYYFPKQKNEGIDCVQIIESGADKDANAIGLAYYKIISEANEFLYILTPYFIIDNCFIENIIQAKQKGVCVVVIIPQKPDKKLVYAGTLKCIRPLINAGIDIYLYKGFLHSKVILSESVMSIGSANFDNRSIKLNFEANALMYSIKQIEAQKNEIQKIIDNSTFITKKLYKKITIKGFWFNILYFILKQIL